MKNVQSGHRAGQHHVQPVQPTRLGRHDLRRLHHDHVVVLQALRQRRGQYRDPGVVVGVVRLSRGRFRRRSAPRGAPVTAGSAAITPIEPSCAAPRVPRRPASRRRGRSTGDRDVAARRRGAATPPTARPHPARAAAGWPVRAPPRAPGTRCVSGTTRASGLPRWASVSCQVRRGPRRGALGEVAEERDRTVGTAPGDRAALHRRQVLRLVDHDVAEARYPFDQAGRLVEQDRVGGRPGRLRRLRGARRLRRSGSPPVPAAGRRAARTRAAPASPPATPRP